MPVPTENAGSRLVAAAIDLRDRRQPGAYVDHPTLAVQVVLPPFGEQFRVGIDRGWPMSQGVEHFGERVVPPGREVARETAPWHLPARHREEHLVRAGVAYRLAHQS